MFGKQGDKVTNDDADSHACCRSNVFASRDAIRRVGVGGGGGGGAREGRGVERCKGWLRKHVAELLHSEGRTAGTKRYFGYLIAKFGSVFLSPPTADVPARLWIIIIDRPKSNRSARRVHFFGS